MTIFIRLPTPLAAAVAELEAWLQGELPADEERAKPREPLSHSTNLRRISVNRAGEDPQEQRVDQAETQAAE